VSITVYPLCNQEMRLTTLLVASTWMTAGTLHPNLVCAQGTALATTMPAATAPHRRYSRLLTSDMIQSAAQRTLSEMQSNQDAYRKDPSKVRSLVDEGWKAYDVSVEGISYIKSYREDFGAQ
jgi:ABC-type transporter MlaC component